MVFLSCFRVCNDTIVSHPHENEHKQHIHVLYRKMYNNAVYHDPLHQMKHDELKPLFTHYHLNRPPEPDRCSLLYYKLTAE